jgi:beta-glucosidase
MESITAQAKMEKDNVQDGSILVEDGVQVTMSSAAMPAASSKLNTGNRTPGTVRDSSWLKADQVNVDYRNTLMAARDLTERTSDDATIVIDDSKTYQNFAGVGTSMEHTTVWNLLQLSEGKRREVIRYMIDPVNGLGMSMFRLPVGTSDFFPKTETGLYSHYDIPGNVAPEEPDWYNKTGSGFSIDKDRDFGVIKVLQTMMEEAKDLGIEDEIHFLATPWSPPGWMKANGQGETGMAGGALKDEHVDDAAMYYVRYIEEYAKEGIPIYALSLQNQGPFDFNIGKTFPSSHMTPKQQAELAAKIKEYLAGSDILTAEQKDVKLWALDLSWEEFGSDKYARTVLDLDKSTGAVDGVAFHDYRANPIFEGLRTIGQEYPSKTVAVSERYLFGTFGMDRIVNYYRNNAISYTSWVTMLNTNGGDTADTSADGAMIVLNPDKENEVRYLPELHMTGQFGKIREGDVRVDSTLGKEQDAEYGLSNVVFKNQETGKMTMVVVNNSNEDKTFTVASDDYQFEADIPAATVATYVWECGYKG